MTRGLGLGLVTGVLLVGCGGNKVQPLPQPMVAPASRTIYYQGAADGGPNVSLHSICDRGTRIYFSTTGAFAAIPGACPDGQP